MKTKMLRLLAIIRLLILVGALAGGVATSVRAEDSENKKAGEEQKAEADDDDDEEENEDEDEEDDDEK